MTKRGRLTLLLVFAVIAAAGAAMLAITQRTAPRSPELFVPTSWKTAREAPMHVLHVGTKKIACSECHDPREDGHESPPTEAVCARCHEPQASRGHRGSAAAPTTCLTCHVFGANEPLVACGDCHSPEKRAAGAPDLDHHAGSGVACGACHTIHGDERVVLADCTLCHEGTSAVHGAFVARADSDGPLDASASLELDAAVVAWLRGSGAPAAPFARGLSGRYAPDASLDRDAAGVSPHDGDGALARASIDPHGALPGQVCSTCHAPHSGKELARTTCAGCHVDAHAADRALSAPAAVALASVAPRVGPRGPRVASHEACVTCHEPHRARKADVRACEGCHADHRAVAAVAGHERCIGCHTPHAPAEARSACASCHAGVATIASPRVPAHAECTSCHDPHRPNASPAQACVRCHESTRPTHPTTKTAKGDPSACVGCHAPHGPRGEGHAALAVDRNAHAAPPTASTCTSCHTSAPNDHAFHAKGTSCTQCHAPHGFRLAGAGTQLCARCHAPKLAATASRPGHASCNACHGAAHSPLAKPACGGCHRVETQTAPRGHATCTSCHDAHSGSLGAHGACTSCHDDKAKAQHANVATGCATCHRPHGPHGPEKPPACATCHARPTLAGLHDKGGHARCETCHSSHAAPRSDRATCTGACHADMRDHQADAKTCKGCHIFRR